MSKREPKHKEQSVATPPGEDSRRQRDVGMGEGTPEALEQLEPGQGESPATKVSRALHGRDRGAQQTPEMEQRRREAYAKLSPDLPEALRWMAADDRVTVRRDGAPDPKGKTVVCWLQRAQRARDNHALDLAVRIGNELGLPVVACFVAVSNFPSANLRHYVFLNQGLPDIREDCRQRNVGFVLRVDPDHDHLRLFADLHAAIVIGDENPIRGTEAWRQHIARHITVPYWTVDADVVVPTSRYAKQPFAAYTLRPGLWRMIPEYLAPFENAAADVAWHMPRGFVHFNPHSDITTGWPHLDRSVAPVDLQGGTRAAFARMELFLKTILPRYDLTRNQPEVDGTSLLSPYLHYGHIGPMTILLGVEDAVRKAPGLRKSADAYLDELLTWRELTIAWVKFDKGYDTPETAADWARKTVQEHEHDVRKVLYTRDELEQARTHDELWNAAQRQMVRRGWMHNYMRMYWAKKVLEWSPSNAEAQKTLIYLNDKYFLDGRDPGGYAGIAWAVYGKFDRPWFNRPIFGTIRYMSQASTGKKFNSKLYIAQNS